MGEGSGAVTRGEVAGESANAGRVVERYVIRPGEPVRRVYPQGDAMEMAPAGVNDQDTAAARRDADENTGEIVQDIEQTREQMSQTIDAIQERLNPETITDQAKDTAIEVADKAISQAKEAVYEIAEDAKRALRAATVGKVEEMANNAKETVGGVRATIVDTIRENPIPAALVGIGLGWLFFNGSSGSSRASRRRAEYDGYASRGAVAPGYGVAPRAGYGASPYGSRTAQGLGYGQVGYAGQGYGYGSREYGAGRSPVGEESAGIVGETAGRVRKAVGGAAEQVQQTASEVAGQVQDTASDLAGQASDVAGQAVDTVQEFADQAAQTAGDLAEQVQFQARRVEEWFQQTLYENPLALGAAAVGLGAAVGLALPRTRQEDQFMGEARDQLVDQVQETARDAGDKIQQVAQEAQQAAKKEAQEQNLIDPNAGGAGTSGRFGSTDVTSTR